MERAEMREKYKYENDLNIIAMWITEKANKYARLDVYGKEKFGQIRMTIHWGIRWSKYRESFAPSWITKVQELILRYVYYEARRKWPEYYEEIRRSEMEVLN